MINLWYDTLRVKQARDVPAVRGLLEDVEGVGDAIFQQIQDVTIRTKKGDRSEYEVKFFNKKTVPFTTDCKHKIIESTDDLRALALKSYR